MMSIRVRLGILYGAVMALVLVILGTVSYYSLSFTLNADVNRTMENAAQTVADSARPALMPQIGLVVGFLEFDVFASPPIYVQAVDREGMVKRTSSNLSGEQLPGLPRAVERALNGELVWRDVQFEDAHLRMLTTPLILGGEIVGALQVGTSLDNIDRALQQLLTILGAGGLVAIVLSGALGFALADRALQPIDRITQTALQISRTEDLSRRIEQIGPQDEVGRLTTTFNEMLERIERLFRTQKRFIGDVSHELRTPLTVIRGNLDIMRRAEAVAPAGAAHPGQQTAGLREDLLAESLAAMERETDRMARLINDLLLLAQADAGVPIRHEMVEIDRLLLDVFAQEQALADGLDFQLTDVDAARVIGDPDRLRQLLLNLVDNAIKYTPAGGRVALALTREDGWVRVDVTDSGVGIPPDDLPHIFERFYRVEKTRSRKHGGTGLGLSIARWIAAAHGGHIDVESEAGEGTTFTIWLPAADEDGSI